MIEIYLNIYKNNEQHIKDIAQADLVLLFMLDLFIILIQSWFNLHS